MAKYLLDIHSAEKFIRILADRSGLRVEFEEDAISARTDGKTVIVPTPSDDWTDDEFTKWLFLVYHELGHNVPEMRDCFDVARSKKIDMSSFLGTIMNIIEDYRQEHFKYDEYEGKMKVMSKGRSLFLEDQIARHTPTTDPKHNMLRALHTFTTGCAEDWMPDLIGLPNVMYKLGTKEQHEWIDTLKAGVYKDDLNSIKTAEDTYTLSKKIIEEVFKLDPEEEEKIAQQSYAEKSDGGEGEEKSSGEEEGESKGKGKLKERKKAAKVNYDDVLIHKHDEEKPSYAPVEIDYKGSTHKYDTYIPYDINDFIIKDYTSITTARTNRYKEISVNTTGFSNKIKRLLTIMSKSTYEYGKRKGRIHNKNLYKVTVPSSREAQEKIFKQKKVSEILNSCVYILVDMSGSMGGEKMLHAGQAAILLNDAIGKLGVPIEIAGFTEGHRGPVHKIFKLFDKKCEGEQLRARIMEGTESMDQNADGESILYSYGRIRNRKEKKKILIVLSDGQPAASRGYGIYNFTQKVIKEIEKQGIVDIYGIGIMTDAVREFYKHNQVLNNSSDLEEVLLSFVKDKLLTNRG